jgi:Plavaka transposase
MEVYQKVLGVIFSSLKSRSWSGEPIRCPDNLVRVFHPGILIESLDGKEAAYFNACRAALANFPCPKCLVHKSDLHRITGNFTLRTTQTMKAVVVKALKTGTKTHRENLLKSYGLHGIQVRPRVLLETRVSTYI